MYMSQHEAEYHKQMIQEQIAPLQKQIEKLEQRLTDVITMLDAPDAYNREYIAAVCRSILSSISRPHRETP